MEDDEGCGSSDESLDAKSDKFDPLKALYSPKFRLPVSNAQVYDNISKYEAVTKGLSSVLNRESKKTDNAEPKRRFLPHQEPIPGGSRGRGRGFKRVEKIWEHSEKNILSRMKGALGPLEMLLKYMEQRTRVKVYTRGARSIRGYILAYVAAFDKHWNLALEDCLEVWTRKIKRKAPVLGILPNSKKDSTGDENCTDCKIVVKEIKGKNETLERHVPQMMIRGEQVAIIVKID